MSTAAPVTAGPDSAATLESAPARDERGFPAYLWLILAGLVLNVFSGNSALLGFPIGPDRLCFAVGFALLLLDRPTWRGVRLRVRPVHVAMAAVLAVTIWSAWAHGSLLSSYGFYALLDRMALPYAFFVLAPVLFGTVRRRDLLLRVLVLTGLYLGVTAFLEIVGPQSLVFPRFIMDPAVGIQFGRARGPFLGSEADGLAMVACGLAAGLGASRWRRAWRLLAGATVVACALGCLLTLTRSIWLGAILAVLLACGTDRRLRRLLPAIGALVAVGVLVALVVVPGLSGSVTGRAGNERSVNDRQNTNAAALRVIERHPLEGLGWVQFLEKGTEYVRQSPEYPVTNVRIEVHNVALGRAAELGLPGGLLWVSTVLAGPVLVAIGRAGGRRPRAVAPDAHGWRLVLIGVLVSWGTAALLSPLPYPFPNLVMWLVAGVAAGPYLLASGPGSRR